MDTGGDAARADLRGGLGWVAFGSLIIVASWRMDRFESMGGTIYTAPGLVPGLFGAMLVLLGAALAWRGWRRRGSGAAGPGALLNRRIVGTLVLTLAYAAGLIGRAPFALATAAFVTLFTGLYSDAEQPLRRWGVALATGVLTAAAVLVVFEQIFLVRLP
jgi:putative tricarboxylic transport membrane protein